jgi:hypothetical protein
MAIYFRAADHREVPAREALDARGILRHGYGQRVPHTMRDAAPRLAWDQHRASLTDGRSGGVQANRPGFRMFTDDDAGRKAIADARASYIRDLENAWRNPPPRDAGFGSLDKKIKKYNAKGQETGYFETEDDDAGDAKKKEDPPKVTGRSRCPECDGRGVVHGKVCQGCGGDGWIDDDENNEDDDDNKQSAASDRRMRDVQAVSATHQQNMAKIYQQISDDVSQRWRER